MPCKPFALPPRDTLLGCVARQRVGSAQSRRQGAWREHGAI